MSHLSTSEQVKPEISTSRLPGTPDMRASNGGTQFARSKIACEVCRANKVRCIRDADADSSCARCTRFGLPCTDPPVQKRRGRPPKGSDKYDRDSLPMSQAPRDFANLATLGIYSHTYIDESPSDRSADPGSSGGPSDRLGSSGQYASSSTYVHPSHVWQPSATSIPAFAPSISTTVPTSSTPRGGGNNPNLDLSEYLDPRDRTLQVNAPKAPFYNNQPAEGKRPSLAEEDALVGSKVSEGDDPLSLLILSAVEAHALVHLFHDRINTHIAVLDKHLHTLQYLRRTSTVLFCAVLASSSKFFRKDLHLLLLSHAQTILDRAITSGASDIGVVQSLMILTYCKAPSDTSAWRKIGMAIRIGYQNYWHVPRIEPLPQDEQTARQVLNCERTWYCLFCFDRGLSQTFGLPNAIRLNEIGDPEVWAREHLHLGESVDMHLAASIELCKLKDHWRSIFDSNSPSVAYCESAIENMTAQSEGLLRRFFTKDVPPPGFNPDYEHVVVFSILDFMLILKRHHLELAPQDRMRLDTCLAVASQTVDEIEILANNGGLEIMQDTASCMTSSLGVFLRKIFRRASRSQKSLIISLLQRILLAHTRVSGDDTESAPAYVARFIRRILGAIGSESRAASPPRGADNAEEGGGEPNEPDFLVQLEEFMQMPENLVQNDTSDGQYWAMLFSADPTNNFLPAAGAGEMPF